MSARNPAPKRTDGLSEIGLMVWRHLRDQGGWHRPFEVAQDLLVAHYPPGQTLQRLNCAAGKTLTALYTRGHVARPNNDNPERPRYGVTSRCKPPEGESMEPASLAVGVDAEGLIHD